MKNSRNMRTGWRALAIATTLALTSMGSGVKPALAQAEPYIGQVMIFAGNFCPRGWAPVHGQLIPIDQNSAMFSILGTQFGGDGRTTFGLPDLRGRSVVGEGSGPGLATMRIGQKGGRETTALTQAELPAHNHAVNATNRTGNKDGPGTDFLAAGGKAFDRYHDGPPNKVMDDRMIGDTGSGHAFDIRDPYLGMTICIALFGLFPSRN
jgi:microcystin-dependent protein